MSAVGDPFRPLEVPSRYETWKFNPELRQSPPTRQRKNSGKIFHCSIINPHDPPRKLQTTEFMYCLASSESSPRMMTVNCWYQSSGFSWIRQWCGVTFTPDTRLLIRSAAMIALDFPTSRVLKRFEVRQDQTSVQQRIASPEEELPV